MVDFVKKMLDEHYIYQVPVRLDDDERMRLDAIKEVYDCINPNKTIVLGTTDKTIDSSWQKNFKIRKPLQWADKPTDSAKGKPTNSEFIALIADRLQLQMKRKRA